MSQIESRNTLFFNTAKIISTEDCGNEQYWMRLQLEDIAEKARPGQFIRIQCDDAAYLRRPVFIMRSLPKDRAIDILFHADDPSTHCLQNKQAGAQIDLFGPIGNPFKLESYRKYPLLIASDTSISSMVFLAEHIKRQGIRPLVLLGTTHHFPFKPRPSQMLLPEMPDGVTASMPLLDDWGVPSRLASRIFAPGCFDGDVMDLARHWLGQLNEDRLHEIELFVCGQTSLLRSADSLARDYQLPCQVGFENYMACVLGGCAGCTVLIEDQHHEKSMKRVCVDGPVFDAKEVVWSTLE